MKTSQRRNYKIALCSDIHCGDPRFNDELMENLVKEVNKERVDLLVVAGDLTAKGYREEFAAARSYIERINCLSRVVVPGNHDSRNVGWVHYEDLIGPRFKAAAYEFKLHCHGVMQENIKVVALDSTKPDLDEGEIGRRHYEWLRNEFAGADDFKVFVLHHHLVSVPDSGRERNIVWDAGDVLKHLSTAGVDMVLCGHRHVPFIWSVNKMTLISSGTAGTHRTRGFIPPAYMLIEINHENLKISTMSPGHGLISKEVLTRPPLKNKN